MKYIVRNKSQRYLQVVKPDWSVLAMDKKSNATEFSTVEDAFYAKAMLCSSCVLRRAYWSDQIEVIAVDTGKVARGYKTWAAKQEASCGISNPKR
jgi:hypothetical protein